MSIHIGITGNSLSGKTTLARRLAALYHAAGRKVIVLDEIMDPRWKTEGGADFVTDDGDQFLQVYWASQNCVAIIDEAGDSVGRYDKAMAKTATRGRHWGHLNIYVVQAPSMLGKNIRRQWGEVYAFQGDWSDGEALRKEFVQPALDGISELRQGEYIHAMRFGPDRRPYYEVGDIFE